MDNLYNLQAIDKSATSRSIQFSILQVPSRGILIDPVTQLQLHSGDSLVTAKDTILSVAAVPVTYRPDANYFNVPNQTWSGAPLDDTAKLDEFSYVVVDAAAPTYRSVPAVVKIRVTNLNDATAPVCPTGPFIVNATDTKVSTDDDGMPSADRVYISGFVLDDLDRQVDLVRVNITAQHGILTLNKQHREDVDFFSNMCYTSTSWYCVGSGVNDMSMVFIGTPAAVSGALNGLRYQSYESNITDSITLTVYDGADAQQGDNDQCISASYLDSQSIRTTCMIASCTVAVSVRPHARDVPRLAAQGYWHSFESAQVGAALGVAGFLILCLVCRWLFVGHRATRAHETAGTLEKLQCTVTPVCHVSVKTESYLQGLDPVDATLNFVQRQNSEGSIGVSSAHDAEM
jgi:hypothetical protein